MEIVFLTWQLSIIGPNQPNYSYPKIDAINEANKTNGVTILVSKSSIIKSGNIFVILN